MLRKSMKGLVAAGLLAAVFLATTPGAQAWYECNDDEFCDIGDDCSPAVDQGTSTQEAKYQGGQGTTSVNAEATEQRWIFTTCEKVSLMATGKATSSATVEDCQDFTCRARASSAAYVENVWDNPGGAWCSVPNEGTDCYDLDMKTTPSAKKYNIQVGVPNTVVKTEICGFAYVERQMEENGDFFSISTEEDCAPTDVHIGAAP